jgi:hypothetical protein
MGGGSTTASTPAPYGYEEQVKASRRKEISENKDLDEESRKELLTYMDQSPDDGAGLTTKYQAALDPENPTTKDRKRRAAARKLQEDAPGLRSQTSFLGKGAGNKSYMER